MSAITWLADLHDRSRAKKLMPRRRAEIAAYARDLAAEAAKLTPEDRSAREEQAAVVQFMLDEQAADYECKLTACYTIIAGLAAALLFAVALLASLARML